MAVSHPSNPAPIALISAAQNLTAAWVDLGAEIPTTDMSSIAIWVVLTINNTQNARVRALAKHTSAGADEYSLPIKIVGSSDVKIAAEYFEFDSDTNQSVILEVELNHLIPFVQFQVQAGTVGAIAGQIGDAQITRQY